MCMEHAGESGMQLSVGAKKEAYGGQEAEEEPSRNLYHRVVQLERSQRSLES